MRYHALLCDYDSTLASNGLVDRETLDALISLRRSGRKLILVTGRTIPDLLAVFPTPEVFDRIVAENGATLYRPATREETVLAPKPEQKFLDLLRQREVSPLSVGHVIIATSEPNEKIVLEAIQALGLELQLIFNKGSVMILPSGVNKATGAMAAFAELEISPHNAAAIGDAENDHAMLGLCECAVAVANALPLVKEHADLVTKGECGAGVTELISRMVSTDLVELEPVLSRHNLSAGATLDGERVEFSPYCHNLLIAGASGSGKSRLAYAILEHIQEHAYQFCVIDPEGDHLQVENAITMGEVTTPPNAQEAIAILRKGHNLVLNLLGVPLEDRPAYFQELITHINNLRTSIGHPHWLIVDEAHHLVPSAWDKVAKELLADKGLMLIAVHPESVSKMVLASVDDVIVVGDAPLEPIRTLAEILDEHLPPGAPTHLDRGEALLWRRKSRKAPEVFRPDQPKAERQRHRRKYAAGDLGDDKSFYFSGPQSKLHLRAQNLNMFMHIAGGVDPETWEFHRKQGDYSRWFLKAIKDEELAKEAELIEKDQQLLADESRAKIAEAITKRYTQPEK